MAIEDMVGNVLSMMILDNEVWRYLIFIFLIAIWWPIAKIIRYITTNILTKWANKTSFQFDDILIGSLNPPINMFVFAGLFYVGMDSINPGIVLDIMQKVFGFLIIIPFVYFMIKFSTEMISFYLKGHGSKSKVNEAAVDLLMSIIRIALFLIGILLILSNLGYNISALLAGLGVGGLAFALAAQDILKNFFAGIALIFDKTFGKGERVNFQGNSGKIEELRLRSTKLRTWDGTLLTIPNAMLADNIVENVTKVPKVKVSMVIGVTYSTSTKKLKEAKKLILDSITKNEHADESSASIWFENFGAYSLDIHVIYFAKQLKMDNWNERIAMKEDINFAIKESFEKAGIEMAFPTQTLDIPNLAHKPKSK